MSKMHRATRGASFALTFALLVACGPTAKMDEVDDARTDEDRRDAAADTTLPDAAPTGLPSQYPFRILQLNLCNSGFAACYDDGLSIPEGVSVIQANNPDVVTLNEICQGDLTALANAMTASFSGQTIISAFKAAGDSRTNAPYKCKNMQDYGIGLLMRVPAIYAGHEVVSGLYTTQDTSSAEQRAWLCVRATGNFTACTTHLATVGSVALAQCQDLMNNIIPTVRGDAVNAATIMSGDLNLRFNGTPNAQDCVPSGYFRKGDGSVQHVLATMDFTFSTSNATTMTHTDHPAWFVEVVAP
jgi:hypothetical protein